MQTIAIILAVVAAASASTIVSANRLGGNFAYTVGETPVVHALNPMAYTSGYNGVAYASPVGYNGYNGYNFVKSPVVAGVHKQVVVPQTYTYGTPMNYGQQIAYTAGSPQVAYVQAGQYGYPTGYPTGYSGYAPVVGVNTPAATNKIVQTFGVPQTVQTVGGINGFNGIF